jgi:hypothetical protein
MYLSSANLLVLKPLSILEILLQGKQNYQMHLAMGLLRLLLVYDSEMYLQTNSDECLL